MALLWYARHPDAYTGDVRCTRIARFRVEGTGADVCDLHADALRLGRTIDTVQGPVTAGRIAPLVVTTHPRRTSIRRIEGPIESGRANATRAAFPGGLPVRPPKLDDRRWHVVQRRWEGATLAEIAAELGVSRERAHQLEETALRVLNMSRATTDVDAA
jgi:hypothetical protein